VATTTSLDDTGLGLDTTTTDLVTTPTRTTT
jgi:hypothetical protein